MVVETAPASIWLKLKRGLSRKCPTCGEGALFRGYLKVQDICPACGENNGRFPSDDAAPYFTIFVVGHLLVPLALESHIQWPTATTEMELAIWLPLALVLTLTLLPFIKGGVIGVTSHFGIERPDEEAVTFSVPVASKPEHPPAA